MSSIVELILSIFKWFLDRKEPRNKEEFKKDVKEFEEGIVENDLDSVNAGFDKLRKESRRHK